MRLQSHAYILARQRLTRPSLYMFGLFLGRFGLNYINKVTSSNPLTANYPVADLQFSLLFG